MCFRLVEAMKGSPADGVDAEEDRVGAAAPEEARDFSVLVQIVVEVIDEHHEGWSEEDRLHESPRR